MAHYIQFGRPKVRSYTWTKIGEIDGNDLLLCDTIIYRCIFGETNDYRFSIARKYCLNLYDEIFSKKERTRMVNHPELGDPVFLLSVEEYMKYENMINQPGDMWWLRSYRHNPNKIAYADAGGNTYDYDTLVVSLGFRPAILIKKEGI